MPNLRKKQHSIVEIPEKTYFTISEVCDLCQLKSHILRRWEQEFPSLGSMKRRGNYRYYQRKDVLLIQMISNLLYDKGYTIPEVKKRLKYDDGKKQQHINTSIRELESVLDLLKQP